MKSAAFRLIEKYSRTHFGKRMPDVVPEIINDPEFQSLDADQKTEFLLHLIAGITRL